MKENPGMRMQNCHELQWTGTRRPQTAVWKIQKSDVRRDNYSKSAQGHIYDIQSATFSVSPESSFGSYNSSQVIDLHTSRTSHGSCKLSNSALFTDRKLPHIHNCTELSKTSTSLDGSSVNLQYNGNPTNQTYLTSVEIKTPWYISVLNEKERCLLKLGEEINRLSRYEVQCKRKDQVISNLKNEVLQLQIDVHRSVYPQTGREENKSSIDHLDPLNLHTEKACLPFKEYPTDVTEGKSQSVSSHKDLSMSSEGNASAVSLAESLPENQRKSQSILMETEILIDDITSKEDEEESHLPMDQPEHNSQLSQKLKEDMEIIRKDYEMSKGVISSLQKTVSSHESKLRKSASEKEALQTELREREIQIQAMSKKFSSLREERKHEEMMASLEQENCSLREMMCELKSEVMRRNEMIAELKSEVQRLQKEISKYQTEVKKQEGETSQIKSKAEDLASSEQHVKVALETLQTKYERLRSKIIQAAYMAPGFKGPQVVISDNEILETMQKIIADRSDFHQQLKQKGVKVSPLYISETSSATKQTSSPSRKKAT
ncbi:coiled-coil domain-containing protein 27 isoform X2 [Bufo bufo]|uniref:coiled-coil domain-containing protein 27 isoform X2 n=1 Tax=Bufo bufo TaxID=8384 RepID=UPI001ABE4509|nr:coiled-coil domain-containing protein 27 isoform X2 [Bufo bufo]